MTKLAPEWVRTSDPVIRSPARYRWTTAPACMTSGTPGIIVAPGESPLVMSVWAGVVMMSRWLLGSFPALGLRERVLTEVRDSWF